MNKHIDESGNIQSILKTSLCSNYKTQTYPDVSFDDEGWLYNITSSANIILKTIASNLTTIKLKSHAKCLTIFQI